jgi:hypothetical protein
MKEYKWKISPMQEVKFVSAKAVPWSGGIGLKFTMEDMQGETMEDGIWFLNEMTESYFNDTVSRGRHIVNTIAGNEGWAKAGSPKELGVKRFLDNLAWVCNQHKSEHFYLKTLFSLSPKGEKRVKFGKTVRFISRKIPGALLSYSEEERADGRLILDN